MRCFVLNSLALHFAFVRIRAMRLADINGKRSASTATTTFRRAFHQLLRRQTLLSPPVQHRDGQRKTSHNMPIIESRSDDGEPFYLINA